MGRDTSAVVSSFDKPGLLSHVPSALLPMRSTVVRMTLAVKSDGLSSIHPNPGFEGHENL
jgi:hypothetical protein